MSTKVAVVIPAYKDELDELEKISLTQCRKILGRYPLIFVAPVGKNFSYFAAGDMIVHFPAKCFTSVRAYSDLLMMPFFYEPFKDFDYILLYQLDAFVFYDALEDFCSLGYDYIGAPWPYYAWLGSRKPKTPRVGNGGFCLRKVKACQKIVTEVAAMPNRRAILDYFGEDAFFAVCGTLKEFNFHVAPVNVAELFAADYLPARHAKKIGGLPFGCHDWTKFSADFYVETFRLFGYDLQPFRSRLDDEDCNYQVPGLLAKLAEARLIRRIEHGQPISHYLPTKNFASVQVVRSPDAMKILSRLSTEDNFSTNEIFIRDAQIDWLRDVTVKPLPHLIISAGDDDASLIAALERGGLRYGRDFVSFRREYLKSCEKLFHSLGR